MGPDQAVNVGRKLLFESLILSTPILLTAAIVSLLLSVLQTLTSIQEQTLTAVPRLIAVGLASLIAMPWFIHRLVMYTVLLWTNFHQYIG